MALSKIPADLITGGLSVDPAAPADAITVTSGGNVGIGKTPVNKPLEIYSASDTALRLQNSTTGTGATDGLLLEASGSDVLLVNYENGNMLFYTDTTERARIDSAGRVTMPYQPSFRVSKNASSANSNSDVIFDVVHHNIGGHYSTSTGRFTAPIDGRYLFCVVNNMGASAGADMFLRLNGTTIAGVEYDPATGGSAYWMGSSIPIILNLSASDYVQIYINGTPTTGVEGAYWNNFSGQLIG